MALERGCGFVCVGRGCVAGSLGQSNTVDDSNESWSFVSRKVHKSSKILDGQAPATDFARPKPVIIMPKSTTLPFIGAVFRRKRLPTQANGFASISSKEPAEAPTLPYSLDGPPLTPGSTPSWANQPWHYVFNVSAIGITSSDY